MESSARSSAKSVSVMSVAGWWKLWCVVNLSSMYFSLDLQGKHNLKQWWTGMVIKCHLGELLQVFEKFRCDHQALIPVLRVYSRIKYFLLVDMEPHWKDFQADPKYFLTTLGVIHAHLIVSSDNGFIMPRFFISQNGINHVIGSYNRVLPKNFSFSP